MEAKKTGIHLLNKARDMVRTIALTDELINFGEDEIGNYGEEDARGLYFNGSDSRFFYQLSADILAKSLNYIINTDESGVLDETKIPLGTSKVKGLPHLPDEILWPDESLFLAQINLEEVEKVDILKLLPNEGILYIFLDQENSICPIVHYKGPLNKLKLRNYPDFKDKNPNYDKYTEDKFKREAVTIEFTPQFKFYIDDIEEFIPTSVQEKVSEILGCEMTDYKSYINLLGEPFYYQGENENYDAPKDIDWTEEENLEILLFQAEFGEGHIHIWVDSKDLENEDFSSSYMTYSGT